MTRFASASDLKRARGLGASGRHAVSHWTMQRVTAVANFLLLVWFLASLLMLPGLDHATVAAWARQPLVAVPLGLLAVSAAWHMRLGVQVMLEDYVAAEGARFVLDLLLRFYAVGVSAVAIWAVLKLSMGVADA